MGWDATRLYRMRTERAVGVDVGSGSRDGVDSLAGVGDS
jgi:hypothetical protein